MSMAALEGTFLRLAESRLFHVLVSFKKANREKVCIKLLLRRVGAGVTGCGCFLLRGRCRHFKTNTNFSPRREFSSLCVSFGQASIGLCLLESVGLIIFITKWFKRKIIIVPGNSYISSSLLSWAIVLIIFF